MLLYCAIQWEFARIERCHNSVPRLQRLRWMAPWCFIHPAIQHPPNGGSLSFREAVHLEKQTAVGIVQGNWNTRLHSGSNCWNNTQGRFSGSCVTQIGLLRKPRGTNPTKLQKVSTLQKDIHNFKQVQLYGSLSRPCFRRLHRFHTKKWVAEAGGPQRPKAQPDPLLCYTWWVRIPHTHTQTHA